jgi:hypothetical protein
MSWKTRGSEPVYEFSSAFKKISDLWLGTLFTYVITLETVCFFIPDLTRKYDRGSQLFLLCYFFAYNLGDTIGKIVAKSFNLKSNLTVHIYTFLRGMMHVYFVCLVCFDPPLFFKHCLVRGMLFFVMGITNGHLTNCYFELSIKRFLNSRNKDYSHFLLNLSIVIGVTVGTGMGILWEV